MMTLSKIWSFKNGHACAVFDLRTIGFGLSVTFDFELLIADFSLSVGPFQISGAYGY
jgi:hypothetical protein